MPGETIVVTRPLGDEKTLTDLLHARGYRVIHEPLTEIFLQHTKRPPLEHALYDEPDACIVTSRHGVQALAALSDLRDLFLICVGEATARTAQSLGYDHVVNTGGTVSKLVEHIVGGYDEDSRFLYLSGEHISADIEEILAKSRMRVQRLVLYEAVAATALSDTLVEHLKRQQIDAITLLSARTAKIFTTLAQSAGVRDQLQHLHAVGLSAAVAEPLANYPWKRVHITREPTLASVIETVDNTFQS